MDKNWTEGVKFYFDFTRARPNLNHVLILRAKRDEASLRNPYFAHPNEYSALRSAR